MWGYIVLPKNKAKKKIEVEVEKINYGNVFSECCNILRSLIQKVVKKNTANIS